MKVVVAWISDPHHRVLITRRHQDKRYGGYWELPGGKLKPSEDPQTALVREIYEELGIVVEKSEKIGEVIDKTANPPITFMLFRVHYFTGIPTCQESQLALRWVMPSDRDNYVFPPINKQIFELFLA